MTHFLVLTKEEIKALENNEPITAIINDEPIVLCSEDFFRSENNQ